MGKGSTMMTRPILQQLPELKSTPISKIHWLKVAYNDKRFSDVLHIIDSEGAEGFAELWFFLKNGPESADDFSMLPREIDSRNPEVTWDRLAGKVPLAVLSLLDLALWDLRARKEGLPLADLLGRQRQEIPAYLSSHFNVGDDDAYIREALGARERGFHGYKVHPRRKDDKSDPVADGVMLRKLRKALGDDFPIMHDPYNAYDLAGSLHSGKVADEIGLAWLESPMPEGDEQLADYVELTKTVKTPVMAPEFWGWLMKPRLYETHERRIRWLEAGATDMGRIDIQCGGLTPCIRLARYCAQHGYRLDFHLCNPQQTQLLAALPADIAPYCEFFAAYGFKVSPKGTVAPLPGIGAMPAPDLESLKLSKNEKGMSLVSNKSVY